MDLPFVKKSQQRRMCFLDVVTAYGPGAQASSCVWVGRDPAEQRAIRLALMVSFHLRELQKCFTYLALSQKDNRQIFVQRGIRRESQTHVILAMAKI